jgi:hypothetical protein
MCKAMPVILVNKVVDPKRIIGKKWRAKEEERHKGSLTQKNDPISFYLACSSCGQRCRKTVTTTKKTKSNELFIGNDIDSTTLTVAARAISLGALLQTSCFLV